MVLNSIIKTGSLDNAIQDFLLALPLRYISQYTIIPKYGKRTHQLKFKMELRNQETMAASKNRFAPELNEKEVIELLQNATQESIKKATNYGMKIFQGKNFTLTI